MIEDMKEDIIKKKMTLDDFEDEDDFVEYVNWRNNYGDEDGYNCSYNGMYR